MPRLCWCFFLFNCFCRRFSIWKLIFFLRRVAQKQPQKRKDKEAEKDDAVMVDAEDAAKEKESEQVPKEPTSDEREREARSKVYELLGEDLTFSLVFKVRSV